MKFFRKSRFNSLTSSSIKKYISYAIGEILLVTIGILIAIWVNNYYKEQDLNSERLKTLNSISASIEADKKEIKRVIESWKENDSLIIKILYETKSNEPIKNCESCKDVLYGLSFPYINEKVILQIDKLPTVADSISVITDRLALDYTAFLEVKETYDELGTGVVTENLEYLKSNTKWFAAFLSKGECDYDCLEYHNESNAFRNRVAYLELIFYDAYQYELITLYKKINELNELLSEQIIKLDS